MLVDSHCHLDFPDFVTDFDSVLERAAAADIGLLLTICTHLSRFPQVLALAERHPQIYCTVGIHPHEVESEGEVSAGQLVALANHPKVVGFGETGLDYYYEHSPRDRQIASFRAHIEAARQTGLPVVIHSRDADDDMVGVLSEEMAKGKFPGLIHCFSSGRALAEKAVALGLYISLSGILTFKKSESLRAIAALLPLDRLLVETDSPFLAPMPHRGKRCEPAFVRQTAAQLAELRGMTLDRLGATTSDNFLTLFRKVVP